MRRWAVASGVVALVVVLVPTSILIGLLFWGYTYFPSDASPPDPSSVASVVRDGFAEHLGPDPDFFAARMFLNREQRVLSQTAFNAAGTTAHLWLLAFWSPSERVTEIAQRAYFGHGFFGVDQAAQGYFGRPPSQLSAEEVAVLALLASSPNSISPWCHREAFDRRALSTASTQHLVPSSMLRRLQPPPEGACAPAA